MHAIWYNFWGVGWERNSGFVHGTGVFASGLPPQPRTVFLAILKCLEGVIGDISCL